MKHKLLYALLSVVCHCCVSSALAEIITVRTENQFRDAAKMVANHDLDILIDAAASPNRGRGDAPAYLFKFEPTVPTIVAFNSVGGAHWPVYTGRYDASLHSVFANDYSAAEFDSNRFAVRLGDGWLSWSDWRLLGFDANSLAPRTDDPKPASRTLPDTN